MTSLHLPRGCHMELKDLLQATFKAFDAHERLSPRPYRAFPTSHLIFHFCGRDALVCRTPSRSHLSFVPSVRLQPERITTSPFRAHIPASCSVEPRDHLYLSGVPTHTLLIYACLSQSLNIKGLRLYLESFHAQASFHRASEPLLLRRSTYFFFQPLLATFSLDDPHTISYEQQNSRHIAVISSYSSIYDAAGPLLTSSYSSEFSTVQQAHIQLLKLVRHCNVPDRFPRSSFSEPRRYLTRIPTGSWARISPHGWHIASS